MPCHFNVPSPILSACLSSIIFVNDLADLLGQYENDYNVELECFWAAERET